MENPWSAALLQEFKEFKERSQEPESRSQEANTRDSA
jgi:hypothetical protein